MTNEVKTTRNLKVIEQSGYRYQATPTVMLKGKWLSEFGFDIGTHVKVECEDGRLIIPVGVYTIVEVKSGKGSTTGWGRLKSGAGWISLDYISRI